MSFVDEFEKIKIIIKETSDIDITESKYDSFIVKKMSKTNCIGESLSSHQTHIAITGDQMNIFPYFYQKEFIEKNNTKMKNFFVLKAPVNIFKNNCNYLDNFNDIDFNELESLKEGMCIYPRSQGGQIQLSMIDNDTDNFIKFRKLIKADDYLIVMKLREKLEYDIFAIKCNDGQITFGKNSIFEYFKDKRMHTFIDENYISNKKNICLNSKDLFPHQRIFFGAPGTGKSYLLNEEANSYFGDNYERVTFHPNYMYGNFVGAYKPFPKVIEDGGKEKEIITYEFVEGVFLKQLIKSYKNPDINYLVLIEEINRANTAAVFGDVFQLLDRDENGESEYYISTSKELQSFLKKEFEEVNLDQNVLSRLGGNFSKLYLPNNFYIWATMNSADQGVMPMDTAFKRRWEFRYIGIDENDIPDRYCINDGKTVISWNVYRKLINKILIENNIPEDKLLGPYFISRKYLEANNGDMLIKIVRNKVLMYLYEDVAKSIRNRFFSEEACKTYSTLCDVFDRDIFSIFKDRKMVDDFLNEVKLFTESEENKSVENVAENKEKNSNV